MNEQPKTKTIPKQRLAIQNYDIDVPYSGGAKQLDRFQAVNLSLAEDNTLAGKPLRFTIFKSDLKTFARGKNVIIADVEERDRPGTEYGPDRTIVQIYDDAGNPVSTKKAGGGGGGYRRSLEDDLVLEGVKRRSIEGQTAVAQVGVILNNNIPLDQEKFVTFGEQPFPGLGISEEDLKRIVGKYWKAVEKGLDNYLAEPATQPRRVEKLVVPPASDARQTPQKANPGVEKGKAVSNAGKTDVDSGASQDVPIKNVGELFTRALKLDPPVKRGEIIVAQEVNDPSQIKDLEAAWKQAQEMSKSKKNGNTDESTDEAWANMNRQVA